MADEDSFVLKGKIVLEGLEGAPGGAAPGTPGAVGPPAEVGKEAADGDETVGIRKRKSLSARALLDRESAGESALAESLSSTLKKVQGNQLVQGIGRTIGSPGASFAASGLAGGGAQQLTSFLGPAIGTAIAGPIGGIIGQALTGPLNSFIDRFFAEQKQVEQQAGQEVQRTVGRFAAAGVGVTDEEISILLQQERGKAERQVDAMKQVAKVQDQTSNTVEGIIASYARRGLDALIG